MHHGNNVCSTLKFALRKTSKDCLQKDLPSRATDAHGLLTPQLSFDGDSATWKWDLHHRLPWKQSGSGPPLWSALQLTGRAGMNFQQAQCGPLLHPAQSTGWLNLLLRVDVARILFPNESELNRMQSKIPGSVQKAADNSLPAHSADRRQIRQRMGHNIACRWQRKDWGGYPKGEKDGGFKRPDGLLAKEKITFETSRKGGP